MNTKELSQMMQDKHFFDLKKMQYKYSTEAVTLIGGDEHD